MPQKITVTVEVDDYISNDEIEQTIKSFLEARFDEVEGYHSVLDVDARGENQMSSDAAQSLKVVHQRLNEMNRDIGEILRMSGEMGSKMTTEMEVADE